MAGDRLGRYELQQRLAQGGMGEVWKALDPQLQRFVAIKILRTDLQSDPSLLLRFEHEAQLIAALRHPNIVQVHDFDFSAITGSERPVAYMVMDYVEGQTLADYIRNTSRKRQFPPASDVIYLLTGVSLALDYAHQQGMIHRDIKPANILLDQRLPTAPPMGEPILTDFGIARLQNLSMGTVVGSIMGTPLYISPEQAQGQPGTQSSDLYSLGIIIYELMTGVTPFRGESQLAVLLQHMQQAPAPPSLLNPQLPPAASTVILKSVAKNPQDRYPSASAMTIALAEALQVHIPGSLAPSQPQVAHGVSLSPSHPAVTGPRDIPTSIDSNKPFTPSSSERSSVIPAANPWELHPSHVPGKQAMVEPLSSIPATTPPGPQQATLPYDQRGLPGAAFTSSLPQPKTLRQPRRLFIALLALAFLVIVGSLLAAYTLFLSHPTQPGNINAGSLHFIQSSTASGTTYDEIQITLSHVPQPSPGSAYYAWLQFPGQELDIPHWQLTVNADGTINTSPLSYPGTANLLQVPALFLVTQESTQKAPVIPSLDANARLYYTRITSSTSTTLAIQHCPTNSSDTACISA